MDKQKYRIRMNERAINSLKEEKEPCSMVKK